MRKEKGLAEASLNGGMSMETRNKSRVVQPSVMWHITDLCNYKCEYCFQRFAKNKPHYGHINDSTIGTVLNTLSALPGSWQIKVGGGEPTIHPRFLDICREVKKLGHTLCLTTNLSMAYGKLKEFIDICGDRLDFVTASVHLSQIDLDEFINKAIGFNSIKHSRTNFIVTSVVTERNLSQLKEIKERFNKENIPFQFQVLRIGGFHWSRYPKQIESYIRSNLLHKTEMIRGKNFFGTLCHSGKLFFIIRANGNVYRCYHQQKLFYYMGNIIHGTFKRFSESRPCLAQQCNCVAAVRRGMICFNERINFFKMIYYQIACYLWPHVRRLIPSTSLLRSRKR